MSECFFCGNAKHVDDSPCPHCKNWDLYWTRLYENKLPQKWGPFIIEKNHFEYKSQKHKYQDIQHIDYETLKRIMTAGPLTLSDDSAKIVIHLENNYIIKENNTASYENDSKIVNLFAVYHYLSEVSFNYRLNRYAKSINTQGYFSYDGARFFKDGHIETRNGQIIYLPEYTIENYKSFFQLTPRNPTLINKIGKGLSNLSINATLWKKRLHGNLTIQTTMDKDVLYSLMLRIYNIQFPMLFVM